MNFWKATESNFAMECHDKLKQWQFDNKFMLYNLHFNKRMLTPVK